MSPRYRPAPWCSPFPLRDCCQLQWAISCPPCSGATSAPSLPSAIKARHQALFNPWLNPELRKNKQKRKCDCWCLLVSLWFCILEEFAVVCFLRASPFALLGDAGVKSPYIIPGLQQLLAFLLKTECKCCRWHSFEVAFLVLQKMLNDTSKHYPRHYN